MILSFEDALSVAAGALLGFYFFASDESVWIPGVIVLFVLLMSLSTPKAMDMEAQFCYYKKYHSSFWNKAIHSLCVWPQFVACLVLVQSYSQPWAVLLSIFYCTYYTLAEPTPIGFTTSALTVLCYEISRCLIENAANARVYAIVATLFCNLLQIMGDILLEDDKKKSLIRRRMREVFVQTILMSPMFVVLELSNALGFRKNMISRRNNVDCHIEDAY